MEEKARTEQTAVNRVRNGVPELGPALGYRVRGDERTERGGQQDEMGTRAPAQKGCWPSHEQDWGTTDPKRLLPSRGVAGDPNDQPSSKHQ